MLKYLNTDHCSDTGIEDFSAERLKTAEHHLNLRKAGKAGEGAHRSGIRAHRRAWGEPPSSSLLDSCKIFFCNFDKYMFCNTHAIKPIEVRPMRACGDSFLPNG